jgi:RNA polymerase sigma-70 factor (ECF subfamily)
MHASARESELAIEAPLPAPRRPLRGRGERVLVREAKRGSADAIEELVRSNWYAAHRAAFLIVQDAAAAEDIAQEAILAAVRAIDDFDRRRPFRPWLHRIVVNRSLDWLRARGRRPEVGIELAEIAAGASEREDGLSDELMEALRQLDPDERALVILRHLLGYRSSELAEMLSLPAATVRTRLARSLEKLRAILGERAAS